MRPSLTSPALRRLVTLIWPFLGGRWRALLATFALTLTESGLGLAVPVLVGAVIDRLNAGQAPGTLLTEQAGLLVAVGAVFLAQAATSYAQVVTAARVSEGLTRDLRLSVFGGVIDAPMVLLDRVRPGDLSSRLTSDINDLQELFTEGARSVLAGVVTILGALAVMLWVSPLLTAIVVLLGPAMLAQILVFRRAIRRDARRQMETLADISVKAQETSRLIRVVRAFGQEGRERLAMRTLCDRFRDSGLGLARTLAMYTVINRVEVWAALAGVLFVGHHLIAAGALGPGALVTFLMLAFKLTQPLLGMSYVVSLVQRAIPASERLWGVIAPNGQAVVGWPDDTVDSGAARASMSPRRAPSTSTGAAIRFEHAALRHGPRVALHPLDLHIEAGETVGLAGPSGAGKTSCLSLMLGFYAPTQGRVLVDGHPPGPGTRARGAYVPQDPLLFCASLGENIAYGVPDATLATITEAAERAGLGPLLARLDQGLETRVGTEGSLLSGGERQRVAIARAFLRDPAVLLMDEPTASLDAATEARLLDVMERLARGRTTVIVSHRTDVLARVPRVIRLDAGRVVADGAPCRIV